MEKRCNECRYIKNRDVFIRKLKDGQEIPNKKATVNLENKKAYPQTN